MRGYIEWPKEIGVMRCTCACVWMFVRVLTFYCAMVLMVQLDWNDFISIRCQDWRPHTIDIAHHCVTTQIEFVSVDAEWQRVEKWRTCPPNERARTLTQIECWVFKISETRIGGARSEYSGKCDKLIGMFWDDGKVERMQKLILFFFYYCNIIIIIFSWVVCACAMTPVINIFKRQSTTVCFELGKMLLCFNRDIMLLYAF